MLTTHVCVLPLFVCVFLFLFFPLFSAPEETVEVRCAAVCALGSLYSRGPDQAQELAYTAPGSGISQRDSPSSGMRVTSGNCDQGVIRRGSRDDRYQHAGGRSPLLHRPVEVASGGHSSSIGPIEGIAASAGIRRMGPPSSPGFPSFIPDFGGGGIVAGASETLRLDELDIALRLSEHYRDVR